MLIYRLCHNVQATYNIWVRLWCTVTNRPLGAAACDLSWWLICHTKLQSFQSSQLLVHHSSVMITGNISHWLCELIFSVRIVFFLFPFHANKHDLCPIIFLSTGKMFAPKQNTNLWGQTKIKILLPTSKNSMIKNRESQWQQLFLLLAVLTMFKKS